MMKPSFFLRFYAQSQATVETYAKEYRQMFPTCIEHEIKPLSQSVNKIVPKDSWEMVVYFATKKDRDEAYANEIGKKWYLPKAYSKSGATFVAQTPGSAAWKNPWRA